MQDDHNSLKLVGKAIQLTFDTITSLMIRYPSFMRAVVANTPSSSPSPASASKRVKGSGVEQDFTVALSKAETVSEQTSRWFKGQVKLFESKLSVLLVSSSLPSPLRLDALSLLLRLIEAEAKFYSQELRMSALATDQIHSLIRHSPFASSFLSLTQTLLFLKREAASPALLALLCDNYLNQFDDLRFYFLERAKELIEGFASESARSGRIDDCRTLFFNSFEVLSRLSFPKSDPLDRFLFHQAPVPFDTPQQPPPPPLRLGKRTSDQTGIDHRSFKIYQLKAHRKLLQRFVLALMKGHLVDEEIPLDVYRRFLLLLPDRILPHLQSPTIMHDFLSDAFSRGDVHSILSLRSLFVLLTKHNL